LDYLSHLTWERLIIPQEELESAAGERDVWVSLLDLSPILYWELENSNF